jgi:hypothetical protein
MLRRWRTRVGSVAQYDFRAALPPSAAVEVGPGSGGGDMEDVLRRLGALEKDVSEIKIDCAGIAAQLPYMAAKADVMAIKADVMAIRGEVSDAKTSIIQWVVATTIAVAALAFAIAKFVH